jgi:hypothetical protein
MRNPKTKQEAQKQAQKQTQKADHKEGQNHPKPMQG